MKQSCYFAKVCDRGVNKKHIGVNLFLLQLCLNGYKLTILCEKSTEFDFCFQVILVMEYPQFRNSYVAQPLRYRRDELCFGLLLAF